MMRPAALMALMAVVLVTACGVDGEPERPEKTPARGITVSGSAAVGVIF